MVYILLGNGFEEIEAVAPMDILRRGGVETEYVSLDDKKTVIGGHGIKIEVDRSISEICPQTADLVVVPGGMGGVESIEKSDAAGKLIKAVLQNGGKIGAICAGPRALGKLGIMHGVSAVCYPGMGNQVEGAIIIPDRKVVTDANIITSMGPATALDFGYALLAAVKNKEVSDKIAEDMCYDR